MSLLSKMSKSCLHGVVSVLLVLVPVFVPYHALFAALRSGYTAALLLGCCILVRITVRVRTRTSSNFRFTQCKKKYSTRTRTVATGDTTVLYRTVPHCWSSTQSSSRTSTSTSTSSLAWSTTVRYPYSYSRYRTVLHLPAVLVLYSTGTVPVPYS